VGRRALTFVKVSNLGYHLTIFPGPSVLFNAEFILLSDVLGVSMLVDSSNNAKPPGATESTVLGPFFTEDAHHGIVFAICISPG